MKGECTMLRQDQNQGGKRRWRCTTDQMLRKTVLPVSAIALCALLLIGLSACGGSHESSGNGLERPAGFTDKQWLGKQLFFDTNLSQPAGQPCVTCHAAQVGWAIENHRRVHMAATAPSCILTLRTVGRAA